MTPLKNFSNAVAGIAPMEPAMESGHRGPRISGVVLRLLTPRSEVPSGTSLPLNPMSLINAWDWSMTGRMCQKKERPAVMRMK